MTTPTAVPAPSPAADAAAAGSAWTFRPARIVGIRAEAPGVKTYRLEPAVGGGGSWRFAAGQFNMVLLPGIGEAALSISSDPGSLSGQSHTVRAVGNVTRALDRLAVGDEVLLRGPLGTPWPLDAAIDRNLVLVGGGLGIASLLAVIRHCMRHRAAFGRIDVLQGARAPADLIAAAEHRRWREHGIDVHAIVADAGAGWSGPVGLVTDLFDGLALDRPASSLFCCGPEPMMVAVAERAVALGIPHGEIFVSIERLMACGTRLCGLCQLGPFFVCHDGPVFAYDRIRRWLLQPHL